MKNQKLKYFMLLATMALLTACASEEEKQIRRENAFDISGHYTVTKESGSDVSMDMSIANESGRHDIIVTVTRFTPFSDRERELLRSQGLSENRIFSHFSGPVVFGRGYQDRLDGGENISDDSGRTSRFWVCTSEYRYDSEYEVFYCLSGKVDRTNRMMTGHLALHWRKTITKYEHDATVREVTSGSDQLAFSTNVNQAFYNQYFGFWTGMFFPLTPDIELNNFQSIEITEDPLGQTFTAVPSIKTLRYQNEYYTYNEAKSTESASALKDKEYPGVQITFDGPNKKRIIMFGQIWSLGDFTGSITFIDETTESDLGTFKFKKQ